jgi:cell division septum initiation protein DivIVA
MPTRAIASVGLLGLGLSLVGCASIPRESVDLSRQVAVEIGKSRAAHLATLDAFYARLRADNDAWVVNTFLPRATANARAALSDACRKAGDNSPECGGLGEKDFERLAAQTIRFRDELQAALENNRDQAVRLINEHYATLGSANAAVTAVLASAVDLNEATRSAGTSIAGSAGVDLHLDAIQKALDAYLQESGGADASIVELEKQLSNVLAKLDKNRQPKEHEP